MAIKKKAAEYQPHGDVTRIISLGGGTWAYLSDHKGKLHHLRRDSEEFVTLCKEVDEAVGGKIVQELEALGWTDVSLAVAPNTKEAIDEETTQNETVADEL